VKTLQVFPLPGIPEVRPGDDLAALLTEALDRAGLRIEEGDVLALAQKIVSKAEGRLVRLAGVRPSPEAIAIARRDGRDPRLVEVVLRESNEVVAATERALIVEHRSGAVCAHGGVDRSNTGEAGAVLLLPLDPDASAQALREAIGRKAGAQPAVLIADTQGRAFRRGVVGVAIGCAGLEPLADLRGTEDRGGRPLEITQVAQADELAAAASAVMGQAAEGVPAVLIRGAAFRPGEGPARALFRPKEEDLFRPQAGGPIRKSRNPA
jgi:coenzyme F420-0:L-glutamate ligase/coenzyme F420-1:gamma-L-glutamate ligase